MTTVSVAIVLGIVVATFAYRRVGTLEREIQSQREAERRNQEDLQRLSARLVDAQEQERRNLARELHDEVGQALTAIKMSVGVALRSSEHDDRARAALDDARGIAEDTLHAVRDLSQLLHPSMLDDFTWFEPFIESYTSEALPWAKTGAKHSFAEFPGMDDYGPLVAEFAEKGARPGR